VADGGAAARWAELQSGRGIPPAIRARVDWNPWHHEPSWFVPPPVPADTPSRAAGLALLVPPGAVLDVGCGGGSAAFALAERATELIGIDRQRDMLDIFAATARERGVPARVVLGEWPDAAREAGQADVVVANHVLHNVVDLAPFLRALTATARRGVVVEMLDQHPMAWLDPLWEHFHGLRRPEPATAADAVAVLHEIGLEPQVTRWERGNPPRQDPAWVARRLCLAPQRVAEVACALDALSRPRTAVTLTWRP
jgi:SAM-dependent methyltransferase